MSLDKKPMMEANPNVRKKLFLTASQVEMLGGYENARSLADGHEIVLIPEIKRPETNEPCDHFLIPKINDEDHTLDFTIGGES